MPYSPAHKTHTRARIVESARRLFNRYGFANVSIDQVMAGAGLTRGGFYHHFDSKDQLYAAAVGSFRTCNPSRHKIQAAARDARTLAVGVVNVYLSDDVLADLDAHCPLYALAGDVARSGQMPRQAYTELLRSLLDIFRQALEPAADAEQRAHAIVSLCVGGMALARTTEAADLRSALRASARQQALALLDERSCSGSGASARRHTSVADGQS